MFRLAVAVSLLISAVCAVGQNPQSSDPFAVSLAQKSVTALTGGAPVADVTLNADVISIYGSDNETGTGSFKAKGFAESRVDMSLSGGTRSDVRTAAGGGAWSANGAAARPYAGHNCRTDAAWFFPVLSALAATATPNFIFKYIAQEQHGSVSTQHIRIFQIVPNDPAGILQRLGTEDVYLDLSSGLPVAVAFKSHPDNDLNTDIDTEARFANYQAVSGILIPFHFQQMINGSVVLDVIVTSAAVNTGLVDSLFTLP